MVAEARLLEQLDRDLERLADNCEANPLPDMDWTRKQQAFRDLVRTAGPEVAGRLFRAGNQVGKTIIGAALTIEAALAGGRGWKGWVVCTSWSQAVSVMEKVWELLPKGAITDRSHQRYNAEDGWGKDNPTITFRNGAVLRFKTTNQGPKALASGTIHWVWIDEPTQESCYRELCKRVRKHRGTVIITLTPVNLPCEWLRKLVDKASVREVHARLDADALTFVGTGQRMTLADGTPMDDDWIATERFNTPDAFVGVVCDGEWECRAEGVFFRTFDPAAHVRSAITWGPRTKRAWTLGIDYASADREFGQVAILSEVGTVPRADEKGATRWTDHYVHVRDEVFMPGSATLEEFAAAVLAMLARNGLTWAHLSKVYGDLPTRSRFDVKSNILFQREIAKQLRVPQRALKPTALGAKEGKRSSGSRDIGCRWIYRMLAQKRLLVHARCVELIKCFQLWDYSLDHPRKDGIDALRYGLRDAIFPFGGAVETYTIRNGRG